MAYFDYCLCDEPDPQEGVCVMCSDRPISDAFCAECGGIYSVCSLCDA